MRNASPSCKKTFSSLDDYGVLYEDDEAERIVPIGMNTGQGLCGRS
jgi:hypothetical protein